MEDLAGKRDIFNSPDLQEIFQNQGYVRIDFLSGQQVNSLKDAYDELQTDHQGLEFHSTMHHNDRDYRRKIDEAIRGVVQPEVNRFLDHYRVLFANYIVKEPGEGSRVGIHQDWNYLDENVFTSLNIWCPLVDTTPENGQLHVVSGSQKLKTPIRFTPYELPPYYDYFDLIEEAGQTLDLKAGEAIIYHPGLLHFSPPNQSKESRPAIGFVNIPQEAQSLHYFRHPQRKDELEVFEVNTKFYLETEIGECPKSYKSRGFIHFDKQSFSKKDLFELNAIAKDEEHGLFKKLFSRIIGSK